MKLTVFVLYEHDVHGLPYCSGHIRLLRPLSHPRLADAVEVRWGRRLGRERADVVIVERLWRPDIALDLAEELIDRVRGAGSALVYAQDDNIFDLHQGMPGQSWLTDEHIQVMERFATSADGIFVSTPKLADRLRRYHQNLAIVPNALDERLLLGGGGGSGSGDRIVIGYMGTRSHDEDLLAIAPALRALHERFRDRVTLEVVGGLAHASTLTALGGLPVRTLSPPAGASDYPRFMPWVTRALAWDIGLAPLRDNVYNQCKSDIKMLDYAAIGCAGVYSDLSPYAGIVDGETGLVVGPDVDAWTSALTRLVEDAALRSSIVRASRSVLYGERLLDRRTPDWLSALKQLVR